MNAPPAAAQPDRFSDLSGLKVARRMHWGRWTAAALIVLVLLALARAFAHGQIEWSYVGRFLTVPVIINGIVNTVVMAVAAMALGILLGLVVAVMRLTTNPVLQAVAGGYTWLFRGTPVILQLLLWFNLALVFPVIGIPGIWSARAVDIMTPFLSALLGLGINQGAYTSEVIRAGMLSVDEGQYEAAQAIGMTRLRILRRIVLPQAMRGGDPAARQRIHRHGQDDVAGQRHPISRGAAQRREHLLRQLAGHRAPDRRRHLVSCRGIGTDTVANAAGATVFARLRREFSMSEPLVAIRGVSKRFASYQALSNVSLDVRAGQVLCLVGASGSGKTTLLRCINQLVRIDSGAIWIDGELMGMRREGDRLHVLTEAQVARQRLKTGMVFSAFQPVPTHDGAAERHGRPAAGARPEASRSGHRGDAAVGSRRARRQGRPLSGPAVRRAATARGDRPRAGDAADADAVRRTDQRARPGARGRSSSRDAGNWRAAA